jgi:hypothetical protein
MKRRDLPPFIFFGGLIITIAVIVMTTRSDSVIVNLKFLSSGIVFEIGIPLVLGFICMMTTFVATILAIEPVRYV